MLPARDGRTQDPAGLRVGRPHGRAGSGAFGGSRLVDGGAHLAPGHRAPRRVALRVRHAGHGVQGVRDAARAQDGHDVHVRPVPGARRRATSTSSRSTTWTRAFGAFVPVRYGPRSTPRSISRLETRTARTAATRRGTTVPTTVPARRTRTTRPRAIKKKNPRAMIETRARTRPRDHRHRLRGGAHAGRRGVESARTQRMLCTRWTTTTGARST